MKLDPVAEQPGEYAEGIEGVQEFTDNVSRGGLRVSRRCLGGAGLAEKSTKRLQGVIRRVQIVTYAKSRVSPVILRCHGDVRSETEILVSLIIVIGMLVKCRCCDHLPDARGTPGQLCGVQPRHTHRTNRPHHGAAHALYRLPPRRISSLPPGPENRPVPGLLCQSPRRRIARHRRGGHERSIRRVPRQGGEIREEDRLIPEREIRIRRDGGDTGHAIHPVRYFARREIFMRKVERIGIQTVEIVIRRVPGKRTGHIDHCNEGAK